LRKLKKSIYYLFSTGKLVPQQNQVLTQLLKKPAVEDKKDHYDFLGKKRGKEELNHEFDIHSTIMPKLQQTKKNPKQTNEIKEKKFDYNNNLKLHRMEDTLNNLISIKSKDTEKKQVSKISNDSESLTSSDIEL
jgi:hypothetical protein